jgi:CheY-like chemotaxis protein
MERLEIPRESIISRPLKFQSLQDCLVPVPAEPGRRRPGVSNRKNIDKTLGKEKPLQILVVDDSHINISVCMRILELFGYSGVDAAADGMQATEMAEKKRYDLILLDLQMPVLDGFGALKRIRSSPLAGEPCCVSLSANVDKVTNQCSQSANATGNPEPMLRGRILRRSLETARTAQTRADPPRRLYISQRTPNERCAHDEHQLVLPENRPDATTLHHGADVHVAGAARH